MDSGTVAFFTLFTVLFFVLALLPSKREKSGNSGWRAGNSDPAKPFDNDALEFLVKLGYPRREAKERVLKVFVKGMQTQEVIKRALHVTI